MDLFDDNDVIFNEAYNKALKLLDYSAQTRKMLYQKMIKKGFTKEIINNVLNRLEQNNLLNDIYYSEIYAFNLFKIKLMGRNKILDKLKTKGLNMNSSNEIIDKIVTEETEYDIARKFVLKNILAIIRLLKENKHEKIRQKLINNGFPVSIVRKIMDDLDDIIKEKKI